MPTASTGNAATSSAIRAGQLVRRAEQVEYHRDGHADELRPGRRCRPRVDLACRRSGHEHDPDEEVGDPERQVERHGDAVDQGGVAVGAEVGRQQQATPVPRTTQPPSRSISRPIEDTRSLCQAVPDAGPRLDLGDNARHGGNEAGRGDRGSRGCRDGLPPCPNSRRRRRGRGVADRDEAGRGLAEPTPAPPRRRGRGPVPGARLDVILQQLGCAAERIAQNYTAPPPPTPGRHRPGHEPRARLPADARRSGSRPEQWAYLDALWQRESGWNQLADNPTSSAYGIPQSLPGSKMAVVGDDWRTNPETQIRWGLAYIAARYGRPEGAWAHSQRLGWY